MRKKEQSMRKKEQSMRKKVESWSRSLALTNQMVVLPRIVERLKSAARGVQTNALFHPTSTAPRSRTVVPTFVNAPTPL
eukprot:6211061-Pleurochrysis_carterae.AAC.1